MKSWQALLQLCQLSTNNVLKLLWTQNMRWAGTSWELRPLQSHDDHMTDLHGKWYRDIIKIFLRVYNDLDSNIALFIIYSNQYSIIEGSDHHVLWCRQQCPVSSLESSATGDWRPVETMVSISPVLSVLWPTLCRGHDIHSGEKYFLQSSDCAVRSLEKKLFYFKF